MAEVLQPLPNLVLPGALFRFWPPASGDDAWSVIAPIAEAAGVARLGAGTFAVLPSAGRTAIFDAAIDLCHRMLARLADVGGEGAGAGVLISPARILKSGARTELERDPLLEDLDRQAPTLAAGGISLTGYAASWLRGRYEVADQEPYQGPSGRRIPLYKLGEKKTRPWPWHNPRPLGQRVVIDRPAVVEAFAATASRPVTRIEGPLGTGKTFAVWHALEAQPGPKLWIGVGRALPDAGLLARRLRDELRQLAPQSIPGVADELLDDRLAAARAADILQGWMSRVASGLGTPLQLVCDLVQSANRRDLELLEELLTRALPCRLLLISRTGGALPESLAALPSVAIPPMEEDEARSHARRLATGLSLPETLVDRWVEAAAGFPFAFEESVVELVHRGLVRRVYGSFFYSGGEDVDYEPSARLVRHVEAELGRLGDPLPLRLLALAGEAVAPIHLQRASARFGIPLDEDWYRPFEDAGWLQQIVSPWGRGLAFCCPAYGRALQDTVNDSSAVDLRRTLGETIAEEPRGPGQTWSAYRLLAGTPEAVSPLLALGRKGQAKTSPEEVFDALLSEHREHRKRGGGEIEELDILWALIPLGRRLGRLSELEPELERALALAASDQRRTVALLLLQSEFAQEQGRFDDAEAALRRALRATGKEDDQQRAMVCIRLGDLFKRTERLDAAREIFRTLLSEVDRRQETAVGATCHFHLGNIALRQVRLDDALRHHKQAEMVRREKGLLKPLGASLSALGAVSLSRGDYTQSLKYYREAEEVMARSGSDEEELGFANLGSGRALTQLGNHATATKRLRRALELRSGRDDVMGEAIARLDVAANQLELGKTASALKEARHAHFQLCMLPKSSLLGDAEQLLGRILMRRREETDARKHLLEALEIHRRSGDQAMAAIDCSYLLELALLRGDRDAILHGSTELEALLRETVHPLCAEMLYFRLYRGLDWLHRNRVEAPEPLQYLRRAYRELMRKTGYLSPEQRHSFLFSIREHQEMVEAATAHDLSWPAM